MKFLWLYAGESTVSPGQITADWGGEAEEYDLPDAESQEVESGYVEEDVEETGTEEEQVAEGAAEEEEQPLDPRAVKKAREALQAEQALALLNDPAALRAHLEKLEGGQKPQENNFTDPDYEAEVAAINQHYEKLGNLDGPVTLSMMFGEDFLTANGIPDRDATPLLLHAAQVANAPVLKQAQTEIAELKLAVKGMINYIQSQRQSQTQQSTQSKVSSYIQTQLPDYNTNPKTQAAVTQAFTDLVNKRAQETAELVGGDWQHIAKESIKHPATYNILLRDAILQVKQSGSVQSVPGQAKQTAGVLKPGVRSVAAQKKPISPRAIEPSWG